MEAEAFRLSIILIGLFLAGCMLIMTMSMVDWCYRKLRDWRKRRAQDRKWDAQMEQRLAEMLRRNS